VIPSWSLSSSLPEVLLPQVSFQRQSESPNHPLLRKR
jgi:hypothetical protein